MRPLQQQQQDLSRSSSRSSRSVARRHSRCSRPLRTHRCRCRCSCAAAPQPACHQQHQDQSCAAALTGAQMMHLLSDRPGWCAVEVFWRDVVARHACLSDLGLAPAGECAAGMQWPQAAPPATSSSSSTGQQTTKPARPTYKLHVSYLGTWFSGWADSEGSGSTFQHTSPSVQAALGAAITAAGLVARPQPTPRQAKRLAGREAQRTFATRQAAAKAAAGAPAASAAAGRGQQQSVQQEEEAAGQQQQQEQPEKLFVACAGRTDAGVSAVGQVASFYSWQHATPAAVMEAINRQLQAAWQAGEWRRCSSSSSSDDAAPEGLQQQKLQQDGGSQCCPLRVWRAEVQPRSFHPSFAARWRRYVYLLPLSRDGGGDDVDPQLVHALLQALEGVQQLDFTAYARDTPPGKDCRCTLLVARASRVVLPRHHQEQPCLAIELVADRFLRRQVRVLVATAVREALCIQQQQQPGADTAAAAPQHQQLLTLATLDRRSTAPGAPATGLCLAGVGYD